MLVNGSMFEDEDGGRGVLGWSLALLVIIVDEGGVGVLA